MTPILSVVIPTYKRAPLLERAIKSSLGASPAGEVEIIVVPNGGDTSWRALASVHESDARITWSPIRAGSACAARNHGLTRARGKYVRFLDDDDYFFPNSAAQVEAMDSYNVDICSAPLKRVAWNGAGGEILRLPDSDDLTVVALSSIGVPLTQGSIFRRRILEKARWREDVVLYDDYIWMLDLIKLGEFKWLSLSEPVGAYVQHHSNRISRTKRSTKNLAPLINSIRDLHRYLESEGRCTPERSSAAAAAVLTHSHSAFPSSPFYLSREIRSAKLLDSNAMPLQSLFRNFPWLGSHLILAEWSMLAPRYLTRALRRSIWALRGFQEMAYRKFIEKNR